MNIPGEDGGGPVGGWVALGADEGVGGRCGAACRASETAPADNTPATTINVDRYLIYRLLRLGGRKG